MDNCTYNDIVRRIRLIRTKFLILDLPEKEKYLSALNRIGKDADFRESDGRNLVDLSEQLEEIENSISLNYQRK